jgi:hypothetical protein
MHVLTPSRAVFQATDAPRYINAFIVHLVMYCVQLAAVVFLRLRLMRLNVLKRRAQLSAVADADALAGKGAAEHIEHRHAVDDLTDFENPDCELPPLRACPATCADGPFLQVRYKY